MRGAIFVLRSDLISTETRNLLQTTARAVLLSRQGSLLEQINRMEESAAVVASRPKREAAPGNAPPGSMIPANLEFFNGLGGFGSTVANM